MRWRHAVAQHRLQQPLQHRLVAELRVAPAFQLRQGHGALAQRLEEQRRGQAAGDQAADHRDGRVDPVAGEAGAVADQEGVVHGRSLSGIIAPAVRRRNRPAPGPAARHPRPPGRWGSPPGCRAGCGRHRDGWPGPGRAAGPPPAAPPSASGRRHSSSGRPGLAPSGTRRSGSGVAARATASSRAVQRGGARHRVLGDEALQGDDEADDLLLPRLAGPADAVVRQAAHLRRRGEFRGRRELRLRQVEVEHLQQRRGHQVAPPGQDAAGLRPAQRLAAGEADEVGALRQEPPQVLPRRQCAAASTSTGRPRAWAMAATSGSEGSLFGPASQ